MKKYWGIIGAILIGLTLTGCGNKEQSKSTSSKSVETQTHKKSSKSKTKKSPKKVAKTTMATPKQNTSTEFSNKSFVTSWIDSVSGIFFKDNQFIWKYTAADTDANDQKNSRFVVMQGTYSYDSKTQTVTLNVNNQSKTYYGYATQLEKYYYERVENTPTNSTLKLKYDNSNGEIMTPLNGNLGTANLENRGSDNNLNYDNIVNKFGVQKVDSTMQKGRNTINSAEEFKQFIIKANKIDTDNIQVTTVANDGEDYDIYPDDDMSGDTPEKTIKARFTVHTNNPVGASEKFMLGDDNNIYWSPEEQTHNVLENDTDTYYHMMYGN